ncbi:MAG: presenilin family intramembrane aspartyl protease, partial [archaeon]
MKHSIKITIVLLAMFLLAQFIGLAVINSYNPHSIEVKNENGTLINATTYNLPYGMGPPEGVTPEGNIFSIVIALIIAIVVMFLLMKFGAQTFLRVWFFVVIILALAITINAPLSLFAKYASSIALLIALPLAYLKVFKRNILVHNATELFIYPGIAAIFVPLLNIWTIIILLIIISLYDMWAVWHSG